MNEGSYPKSTTADTGSWLFPHSGGSGCCRLCSISFGCVADWKQGYRPLIGPYLSEENALNRVLVEGACPHPARPEATGWSQAKLTGVLTDRDILHGCARSVDLRGFAGSPSPAGSTGGAIR